MTLRLRSGQARLLRAALGALALLCLFVVVAHAQGEPGGAVVRTVTDAPGLPGISTARTDIDAGSGGWMALLFWIFAGASVLGSIFVITRRNLITAVMGMVGSFFGLAVLYMMLYASFLAVIQMLVYAGAIMVLFVFVIMVLNKPEDEPWGVVGLPGKVLAGIAMLYLLVRATFLLWSVTPPDADKAAAAPAPVRVVEWQVPKDDPSAPPQPTPVPYDFGSTAAVGHNLFNDYVFPFEAVSILLLIAVVGAIAIARPLKDDHEPSSPGGAP